ncbi:MAG: DUF116 domain-containing protein [Actinomycetota bacterium]|nr:DUF116 domain-containing protein [Actinomycetota bacterium]
MRRPLRGALLKVIYPLLMLAGGFSKNFKERLQALTISMNNRLVMNEGLKVKKLLILLPHCLQRDECKIRITTDIYNCARCGKCEIRDIIDISEKFGIKLSVATGGNLARRIVSDLRPDAIVAVACERDLSSGIADSFPLPVLGICNERPFGPCRNTRVDLGRVKWAIESLAGKGK